MGRVSGKIALVTGAAQGLGEAIAGLLAGEGARVLCTDINEAGVERVAGALNDRYPDSAYALRQDVADEGEWKSAVSAAAGRFGGLHILVNNAGIGSLGSVEQESYETWTRVHKVDLDSVFLGCKYAIPLMRESGGGSIINISSIAGIVASDNMAAYNSAKAAVRHLSKSVALHCAKTQSNIRCNSVHPVFTATPILEGLAPHLSRDEVHAKLGKQIPLGRIAQPNDVAYAVLYLASDESGFVTGSEIKVDGGISAL